MNNCKNCNNARSAGELSSPDLIGCVKLMSNTMDVTLVETEILDTGWAYWGRRPGDKASTQKEFIGKDAMTLTYLIARNAHCPQFRSVESIEMNQHQAKGLAALEKLYAMATKSASYNVSMSDCLDCLKEIRTALVIQQGEPSTGQDTVPDGFLPAVTALVDHLPVGIGLQTWFAADEVKAVRGFLTKMPKGQSHE